MAQGCIDSANKNYMLQVRFVHDMHTQHHEFGSIVSLRTVPSTGD